MRNARDFILKCKDTYSKKEVAQIEKALIFMSSRVSGERKISGKPLSEFNIDVSEILIRSGVGVECVVSGLLYGLEKSLSFDEVEDRFGEEVAEIVFGQLKLRTIKRDNVSAQADLIRKILLTGLSEVRVIFVKLAVKLANLRIISSLGRSEQKRVAEEVLDLYVPLASRLGLDYIKNILEDRAFNVIHPKKYKEISNFFQETQKEREKFIEKFISDLKGNFSQIGIVKIKGRSKQIRSIFKKIVEKGTPLKKQKDHYAIRVIVKSERDCYDVLGILHEKYLPVDGRLKDYIASPKPNGYRSLHTVIKIPKRKEEIEVQIRTIEMDEFAEEGKAAHWSYKKTKGDSSFEKKVGWLRALIESQRESSNREFMKDLKVDLFADKIYCYTPKGDVRELAKGATLLDFAYSIHQEVGERAVGGRVNGKFVPLKEKLENGVVVEILTNKNQRPRRDWLKFVVSTRAKAKIRKGIRRYESLPIPKKQSFVIKKEGDYDSLVESPEFGNKEFNLAKCCYPLPKDELIGIQKSHRKFLVHKSDCGRITGNLNNAIPVYWKEKFNRPLVLKVLCADRSGILSDLLNTISRGGFAVKSANAKIVGNEHVECKFTVVPRELEDVCWMIKKVKKVRSVMQVFFG